MLHLRPEAIAGILMKLVTMGTGEQDPVAEQEASHQGGESTEASDGDLPRHNIRESRSCVGRRQTPIRYGQDGNQPGTKRKSMHLAIGGAQHEPSINRGGGVIGMLFHVGRQFEKGSIVGLLPDRTPGGGRPRYRRGRRRPETAPDRDPVVDHQGQRSAFPDRSPGRFEDAVEMAQRVFGSHMTNAPEIVRRGIHHAAQLEGQGEHVEARTEIGR